MKASNFFLFGLSALASYQMTKNRKQITAEVTETGHLVQDLQHQSQRIQDSLARIQSESQHLQEVIKDISYETTTFNKIAQARLAEIQTIWQNTEKEDEA